MVFIFQSPGKLSTCKLLSSWVEVEKFMLKKSSLAEFRFFAIENELSEIEC